MLNIVIPMAGLGTRFAEKGYKEPKPLIPIKGEPMIELVIRNLTPAEPLRFIFICREEHIEQYGLDKTLKGVAPNCEIIRIQNTTAGQACSVLLAKGFINNDEELLTANSDQYVDMDINDFLKEAREQGVDGLIMTFWDTNPKWSFVRVDKNGYAAETAEKRPISSHATVGIYYFRRGRDFVQAAENMIRKNIRVNNEFYTCPVFNEMILADKKIKIYEISKSKMHGLGTPEDLEEFKGTDAYKNL